MSDWIEKAAWEVLDEIHFQRERPTHPTNAKWLDKHAPEIAAIIRKHAPPVKEGKQ